MLDTSNAFEVLFGYFQFLDLEESLVFCFAFDYVLHSGLREYLRHLNTFLLRGVYGGGGGGGARKLCRW